MDSNLSDLRSGPDQEWEEVPFGELCSEENSIKSSDECQAAAKALGLIFLKAFNGKGDFPGCFKKYGVVYFNTASETSTYGYPLWLHNVRPICRKGGLFFAEALVVMFNIA